MTGERWVRSLKRVAVPGVACLAAVAVPIWGGGAALGIVAGGGWNLASLWCLAQLLDAWLGPHRSTRRVIGWLLIKFPLLYAVAYGLLRLPGVSLIGFSVGFTAVLAAAVALLAISAQRSMISSMSK